MISSAKILYSWLIFMFCCCLPWVLGGFLFGSVGLLCQLKLVKRENVRFSRYDIIVLKNFSLIT